MDTMTIVWEGHDGSSWSLLDPFSPVRLASLEGFGMPTFTTQFSATGARDGRRYEGTIWGHSAAVMTVFVGDDYPAPGFRSQRRGDDWRALDAQFRKSLSPEFEGRLVVTTGAGRRMMRLRLERPVEMPARNSAEVGQAIYALSMTADDHPWWEGDVVTEVYEWDDPSEPFYGGPTGEDLFYISGAGQTNDATITNPGERAAWTRWWARGPVSSVTVGVGGLFVPLPFALGDGDEVHVDSELQTITSGLGENLWPKMGFADPTFAPIRSGEKIPINLVLNDPAAGAAVGFELTPLYEAPW